MHRAIAPSHRAFAKTLRTSSTDAERKLWSILRASQLKGLKFKRQVPLDGYIVDFVCFEARLIVELDGGQHWGSDRDAHFRSEGFRTVRLWNNEVLQNIKGVHARLLQILGETGDG